MNSSDTNTTLLRIRPSLPLPDEVSASRGPLMMETALSSLHSIEKSEGPISLELGIADGKIGLFARSKTAASPFIESQLYGQYPDAEIENAPVDLFDPKKGEIIAYADLALGEPELFPIKRYPQFTDMASRQTADSIAGVTATLVRYPKPGMRGHIQIVIQPMRERYRKRALKFLPFLEKGISKRWTAYARLFTEVHMATGWKRLVLFPLDMLMGGFRVWMG